MYQIKFNIFLFTDTYIYVYNEEKCFKLIILPCLLNEIRIDKLYTRRIFHRSCHAGV